MNDVQNLPVTKKFSGKKLLTLLGVAILAVVGIGGYAYSKLGSSEEVQPPTLEMDLTSLAQGKLSTLPGFADLPPSYGYGYESCTGGITLARNVNHLFATKDVTMKEVANALKFGGNDGQYLVAFFTPGNEKTVDNPGKNKQGWYIYPTDSSPFNSPFNSQAVSSGSYEVNAITDDNFKIPAYRGFQIIVNNSETKMCGVDFKLSSDTTNVWGSMNEAELTAKIETLPDGWVMIPMLYGSDTQAKESKDSILGVITEDRVKSEFFQTEKNKFISFDGYSDSSYSGYIMEWLYIEGGAIVEKPVCDPDVCGPECDPDECGPVCDPDVCGPECGPDECGPICGPDVCDPGCDPDVCDPEVVLILPTVDKVEHNVVLNKTPGTASTNGAFRSVSLMDVVVFFTAPVEFAGEGGYKGTITFNGSVVGGGSLGSSKDGMEIFFSVSLPSVGSYVLLIDGLSDLDGNLLPPSTTIIEVTEDDLKVEEPVDPVEFKEPVEVVDPIDPSDLLDTDLIPGVTPREPRLPFRP